MTVTDDQAVPLPPDGIARTAAQIASDVYRCGGTWQQVLDAAAGPRLAEVRAQGAATERERIHREAQERITELRTWPAVEQYIEEARAEGAATEREACAKLAEQHHAVTLDDRDPLADLIRARTTP